MVTEKEIKSFVRTNKNALEAIDDLLSNLNIGQARDKIRILLGQTYQIDGNLKQSNFKIVKE